MTRNKEHRWFDLNANIYLPGMFTCELPSGVSQDAIVRTEPIAEWPCHATCELTPGARLYDLLLGNVPPWYIMSDRAALVFKELGGDAVECLPVFLVRDGGDEVPGYSVVHIMREIAAYDREHGFYQVWKGELRVIRVSLLRAAVEGVPVFRLSESPTQVVVSDDIKRRLVEMRVSGFDWTQLGVY